MNKTIPLVSAIIPTYNHGDYIARAIDSIITQEELGTRFEVEVIVVDDASTDATAEVVRRSPQVRYLRHSQRQGVAAAINAGIRASSGQYISFLAADDTWLPHKLRIQVPSIMANPHAGVLYSQSIRRCNGVEKLFPEPLRAPSGWVFEPMLTDSFAGHFASLLVLREAFEKAGYFDETLTTFEDYDMALRLAFHFQFLFEPGPVTIYNLSPRGLWLTSTLSGQASKDYARVIEKALNMLPESATSAKLREEAPIRVAVQPVAPLVLTGELTQAWKVMLEVLRRYPSSVRHRFVRDYVCWIVSERLAQAASPVAHARELCAQIEDATRNSRPDDRQHIRRILAEIWAGVLFSDSTRARLKTAGAAYAAIRAVSYAGWRPRRRRNERA